MSLIKCILISIPSDGTNTFVQMTLTLSDNFPKDTFVEWHFIYRIFVYKIKFLLCFYLTTIQEELRGQSISNEGATTFAQVTFHMSHNFNQ